MDSMILLVAMIAVFYFLIIRPENKRKKQAETMRNSLKKGERITYIRTIVQNKSAAGAGRAIETDTGQGYSNTGQYL